MQRKYGVIIAWFVIFIFIIVSLYHSGFDFVSILKGTESLGVIGIIIYLSCLILAPVFFVPITPLCVTAGMFFGLTWGLIIAVFGATVGSSLSFLISRYLLKDWIDKKSPSRIILIKEKLDKFGWRFIAIARISPLFPFSAQNYLFGVTNIKLSTYIWATLFSLIPGVFTYVYLGYAGQSAYAGVSGFKEKIIVALLFLLLLTFLPYLFNKIRKPEKVES